MTNQSTIDKLIEMHMTSMADAFRNQMQDISMKEIPFDDRFGMIVDIEYTSRKNSHLKRLIKNAEFEQPDASIAAVGILVSVLCQILKHSGREEQAFLTSLAGLLLVLFWMVPYIYQLFETMKELFAL